MAGATKTAKESVEIAFRLSLRGYEAKLRLLLNNIYLHGVCFISILALPLLRSTLSCGVGHSRTALPDAVSRDIGNILTSCSLL